MHSTAVVVQYLCRFVVLTACALGTTCAAQTASISVQVVDPGGEPLPDVSLSVCLWRGDWERTEIRARTDASGRAELKNIPPGQYLTIAAEAESYASVCQDAELADKENRAVKFQLKKPVRGKVRLLDDAGNPIRGAVLSALSFADENGGSLFHRFGTRAPFPFEPTPSDDDGTIELPEMPESSKVGLTVYHEQYISKKLENLKASNDLLATITLQRGVPLRVELIPAGGLSQVPAEMEVLFRLSPSESDRQRVPSIYHRTPIRAGVLRANVPPAIYSELYVSSHNESYTITPYIETRNESFRQLLQVPEGETDHEIQMLVRKNVQIRGKIAGYLGGLNARTQVIGWCENLHPTLPIRSDSDRWFAVSFGEIEKDGSFEVQLPPGKSKVGIRGLKASIIEPGEVEFTVEPEKPRALPDFEIRKIEQLSGTVVDANQKPVAGAIARLIVGVWGGDYARTDENGIFKLAPDLLSEWKNNPQTNLPASIIAFDPATGRSGRLALGDDWQANLTGLQLVCRLQADDLWLLGQIEEQRRSASAVLGMTTAAWEKEREKLREANPDGAVGQVPPDLSNGTWLNSPNRSLKDFRGKYVLLDFWFIGCGPCEGDLPTVKLAQELFGPDRFTVVSVHVTQQTPENVRQYAEERRLGYPVVVDNDSGDIARSFQRLGLRGFPSYMLLDPEGRILFNDNLDEGPSLRGFKVERIFQHVKRSQPQATD